MNLLGKIIFCPRYTRRLLITLVCKKYPKFCGISGVEAIFHLGHFFYTPCRSSSNYFVYLSKIFNLHNESIRNNLCFVLTEIISWKRFIVPRRGGDQSPLILAWIYGNWVDKLKLTRLIKDTILPAPDSNILHPRRDYQDSQFFLHVATTFYNSP